MLLARLIIHGQDQFSAGKAATDVLWHCGWDERDMNNKIQERLVIVDRAKRFNSAIRCTVSVKSPVRPPCCQMPFRLLRSAPPAAASPSAFPRDGAACQSLGFSVQIPPMAVSHGRQRLRFAPLGRCDAAYLRETSVTAPGPISRRRPRVSPATDRHHRNIIRQSWPSLPQRSACSARG